MGLEHLLGTVQFLEPVEHWCKSAAKQESETFHWMRCVRVCGNAKVTPVVQIFFCFFWVRCRVSQDNEISLDIA